MKKILIIIPSLGGGGAEKVLVDILNRFDYKKYEVNLLVIHYFGPYLNQINENVKIFYLYKGQSSLFLRLITKILRLLSVFDLLSRFRVCSIIKDTYDAIISFTTNEALYYHSFLFGKSKKNINWVHVDVLKNHTNYPFRSQHEEIRAYTQIDQIVFVSNDAQKAFNSVFSNINAVQSVIYNLIDKDAILKKASEMVIKNDRPTIVTVGRLTPVKGYERLIKVARMLKNDGLDFQCQIIGTGMCQNELSNMIKEEGVEDVVSLLGFKANPYPYMSAADIFISTSYSEAFPLVVCESLCLGKPIVSTRTTGPIEILEDKYGILTEHDINDIYINVKRLLENPEMINKYKQLAINRSEMFDVKSTMECIYKII